jgi:hypothetical protein
MEQVENVNPRLAALRKRAAQLTARIELEEAKDRGRARKEDTRLKVLIGAAFLADVAVSPEGRQGRKAHVCDVLKRAIPAPRDREFLKTKGWL